MIKIWVKFW